MSSALFDPHTKTILIVGASRGLGYAMAAEFLHRGWNVVGTVRGAAKTLLHDLSDAFPGRVEIALVDICETEDIHALTADLTGRTLDILFVNAGAVNAQPMQTIGEVSIDEFVRVMVTNALGPMRVIEALLPLVSDTGLVGAMSSGQGSVANNETGMREVYRASKAALNMLMRSFAARQAETARSMVLMAPGWIRTDLGGAGAPFTMEDAVPDIVNTLLAKQTRPGLEYLDRFGKPVPW